MILSKILGDCPKCGAKDAFGICLIGGRQVLKGCGKCNQQLRQYLPALKKRVVYLDQCFLSAMFRRDDEQIVEAGGTINRLAHYQQVVSPFARVHETESLQWIPDRRDDLFQFIKQTARGHRFKLESEVKTTQMCRSLRQYLGQGETVVDLQPSDALPRDLHDWDNYMWINMKISLENPEETRRIKGEYAERLVALFPKWRGEAISFKDLRQEEIRGTAHMLWTLLADTMSRWHSPDPASFMFSSQAGEMMLQLLTFIRREAEHGDAIQVLDQYLRSAHFAAVPHIAISASLHAKLRQRVQQGYYSNLEKAKDTFMGFPYDAGFVSVFGPYCDAMFIDNTVRQWLEEKDLRFRQRYGTLLFSKSNVEDFVTWLKEIEATMQQDVREAAREMYF